jgi:hypothetical protein
MSGYDLPFVRIGGLSVSVTGTDTDPRDAVTVTCVCEETGDVENVTDALVAPAGTVIEAGALTSVLDRVTVMASPPAGAGELMVTVAVTEPPPVSVTGLSVNPVRTGAFTVKDADRTMLPDVAVMVTAVSAATGVVVIVKYPVVCPAAIVIEAGTWRAAALLLARKTVTPPSGAADGKLTRLLRTDCPPAAETLASVSVKEEMVAGATVRLAVRLEPCSDAVMVTAVEDATADVEIVKAPELAPAGMVSVAGTDAAPELLESETTTPPAGAGESSVTTFPARAFPPVTLVAPSETE